jgi:hypothetical protein
MKSSSREEALNSSRRLWLLIRTRELTRRFLRIGAGDDGSLYFSSGWQGNGVRIASADITIPAGQASASTDYTQHIKKEFVGFKSEHIGFKASGTILHKFDNSYHRTDWNSPAQTDAPLLLQTIYPGRLARFKPTTPRKGDLIAPDDCVLPLGKKTASNIEEFADAKPFRVEIWQLPESMESIQVNNEVLGCVPLLAAGRKLIVAFCQNEVDIARGWLDKTVTLMMDSSSQKRT